MFGDVNVLRVLLSRSELSERCDGRTGSCDMSLGLLLGCSANAAAAATTVNTSDGQTTQAYLLEAGVAAVLDAVLDGV